jgi:hypothetical protein
MKKILFALALLVALPAFAMNPYSGGPSASPLSTDIVIGQGISEEISFAVTHTVLGLTDGTGDAMSIPGLTGGESATSTVLTVITNNASGYNITLAPNADAGKMMGPVINSVQYQIPAYPGYGDSWSIPANTSAFGYSYDGGSTWYGATTTYLIGGSLFPTDNDGDDTTLAFKVEVKANPNPMLAEGYYYATTTVTATMNP